MFMKYFFEFMLDSVRMMESYADAIVLRHPEAHSAKV